MSKTVGGKYAVLAIDLDYYARNCADARWRKTFCDAAEAIQSLEAERDAALATIREMVRNAEVNERADIALHEIARVKYGIDGHETDEELINYWSRQCLRYEKIAREAIAKESSQ